MGALRIERDGDLLRVTLARPETRNAFDAALIAELAEAFVDVGKARAVLLAGDGPSFCAGADVEWMRASVDLDFDANVADANALRGMLEAIDRCPAPVVARVQGHALGGGAGLVACADIAVAGETRGVRLLGGEARDHPGGDLAVRAREDRPERGAALLRHRRALRRGRRRCGSGSCTRSPPTSTRRSSACSRSCWSAGPRAARHAKKLVLERPDGPETARRIAERRTSDEGQEGLQAFLERRSPDWARLADAEQRARRRRARPDARAGSSPRARRGRSRLEEAARVRRHGRRRPSASGRSRTACST